MRRICLGIAILLGLSLLLWGILKPEPVNSNQQPQIANKQQIQSIGMKLSETRESGQENSKKIEKDWSNPEYIHQQIRELLTDPEDAAAVEAIIECESETAHFWEPFRMGLPRGQQEGDVKNSKGNIGFGQLNATVWAPWFSHNFHLDIYDPQDNLEATVILYEWMNFEPWLEWSGHCFVPILSNHGFFDK
jgi:hypothetical protein